MTKLINPKPPHAWAHIPGVRYPEKWTTVEGVKYPTLRAHSVNPKPQPVQKRKHRNRTIKSWGYSVDQLLELYNHPTRGALHIHMDNIFARSEYFPSLGFFYSREIVNADLSTREKAHYDSVTHKAYLSLAFLARESATPPQTLPRLARRAGIKITKLITPHHAGSGGVQQNYIRKTDLPDLLTAWSNYRYNPANHPTTK